MSPHYIRSHDIRLDVYQSVAEQLARFGVYWRRWPSLIVAGARFIAGNSLIPGRLPAQSSGRCGGCSFKQGGARFHLRSDARSKPTFLEGLSYVDVTKGGTAISSIKEPSPSCNQGSCALTLDGCRCCISTWRPISSRARVRAGENIPPCGAFHSDGLAFH